MGCVSGFALTRGMGLLMPTLLTMPTCPVEDPGLDLGGEWWQRLVLTGTVSSGRHRRPLGVYKSAGGARGLLVQTQLQGSDKGSRRLGPVNSAWALLRLG